MKPPFLGLCALLPLGLAQSAPALQPPPGDVRRQIESLADSVDEAVGQVSRPSSANLFGPAQLTRGYRIPGMGVVLVVPARSLPSSRARWPENGPAQPAGGAPGNLGQSVAQMPAVPGRPPLDARGGSNGLADSEDERAFRAFVQLMQEFTIRSHQAAERNFEQFQERMQHGAPAQSSSAGAAPPQMPPGVEPDGAQLPPAPPWAQFFDEAPETRTARQVLDDVRAALVNALPAKAPGFLADDEWIVVTVDFFEDALDFVARPSSTLVARVRARDVVARRGGTLSAEDFRKRIEYSELP